MNGDNTSNENAAEGYSYGIHAKELYLGHPSQYWVDFAVGYAPLIIFFVLYALFIRKWAVRQNKIVDTQYKSYEEFQKIAKSLAEIAQKMDKKLP